MVDIINNSEVKIMKKSVFTLVVAVILGAFILGGCSNTTTTSTVTTNSPSTTTQPETMSTSSASEKASQSSVLSKVSASEKTFTLTELATYDGQNGNPAYIAVDGIVYDVTDIPEWKGGQHNQQTAGQDLTEAIASSPHGKDMLKGVPVVGTLT